jgi:hypothetical protein
VGWVWDQVDVIEAEYKTLEDKVAAAHDFVEVERAHHQYLSALLSQTFLDVSLVSQSLASVLSQCLALCRTVQVRNPLPFAGRTRSTTARIGTPTLNHPS